MKIPEPKREKSGLYAIRMRLGGVSVVVRDVTAKGCRDKARLEKAERMADRVDMKRSTLTLRQACERHIAMKERAEKSPETIRGYDVILRNRFQSAMDRRVCDIKNWQELYDEDAERLSAKTMENTWAFIKAACERQCGVKLPEIEQKSPEDPQDRAIPFLEPEQVKVFVQAVEGTKHQIPIYLMLCSLRASEMRGLMWKDVDLKSGTIHVNGAVVVDKHGNWVHKKKNKTRASKRYVPIFIPELAKALAAVPDKTGPVCSGSRNTVYREINRICEENGLPLVGQHGLRHSFASLAYSLNVPLKITMEVGGWDDYKTLERIYTHLAQRDINMQSQLITDFFKRPTA